jgi:hypothetical protein
VHPDFSLNKTTFEKHLDNDTYWKATIPRCGQYDNEGCGDGGKRPAEELLTQRRDKSYTVEIQSEVREAKQTFIKMLISF